MNIGGYLSEIRALYKNSGQTTEHSFRPALNALFQSIDPALEVINEPKRLTDVGAPDFVFNRDGIAIGWCEAKDLDKDIQKFKASDYSKAQKERYSKALPNLIYTNGIDFEFIRDGKPADFVSIAYFTPGLPEKPDSFETLERLLTDFASQTPVTISSAKQLAEMMAGKAALIKDIMGRALIKDQETGAQSELIGQYEAFKANLIQDITIGEFADIYAETISYGLFAARLHDTSMETFSRAEALELLPKSNPFLRKLFVYIAGPDLDDRIRRTIDTLCQIFRAANLHDILKDFGKFTGRDDPFLHFYETFLAEYNPKKRKARGVWYTPEAVVNFVVRAVDDVLEEEFGLPDGLADTSKISIDWDTGQTDKKGKPVTIKKDVHRVQILDPATGTGTFLAEVIKQVAGRVKGIAPGQWSTYVENNLIPRIHGFELLMASYAMCHMKLDMVLTELGYKPSGDPPRLGVYLTNSLEEGEKVEQTLFAQWLANEAKAASDIKRQTPIMCVIGNPPYSGESANKGPWIMDLMEAYKKEPGGKEKLKERNPKWINDDYVKFLRFAEHMIAKNGEGIVGFITNHGYLDNPTFRGMRWHLLKTFDKIWVLDLHGNSKKKEVCPDGSPDKNVFDIMQGVAIIIGVKKKTSITSVTPAKAGVQTDQEENLDSGLRRNDDRAVKLAEVWHGDLWGKRDRKNAELWAKGRSELANELLPNKAPQYPMVQRDFELEEKYLEGFSVAELMPVNSVGIVTARDALTIDIDRQALWNRVQNFTRMETEELRSKYDLGKDVRDWKVQWAKDDVIANLSEDNLVPIAYRPFDTRWTFYTGNSRGFHCYPRDDVMRHVFQDNLSIGYTRTIEGGRTFADVFTFTAPITHHSVSIKEVNSQALLYLYPEEGTLDQSIRVNFDPRIYAEIRERAGLGDSSFRWNDEFRKQTGGDRPDEVKVFDYIYGVLHAPNYRETYKEFLKIDFPRIPYPASPEIFATISDHGEALRRLHLMEEAAIGDTPHPFDGEPPEDMTSIVDRPRFELSSNAETVPAEPVEVGTTRSVDPSTSSGRTGLGIGRVYINGAGETGQYFDNVPELAWNFYIGGYQPAQKWLKDRKGRQLSWDDIRHYQKIIKILTETDRIMREIALRLD